MLRRGEEIVRICHCVHFLSPKGLTPRVGSNPKQRPSLRGNKKRGANWRLSSCTDVVLALQAAAGCRGGLLGREIVTAPPPRDCLVLAHLRLRVLLLLPLVGHLVEVRVDAALFEQLLMRAYLCHLAAIENHDA